MLECIAPKILLCRWTVETSAPLYDTLGAYERSRSVTWDNSAWLSFPGVEMVSTCMEGMKEAEEEWVPKKKEDKVVLYSGHDSPIAAFRAVNMGSVSIRGTPIRIVEGVCILESADSMRERSGPSIVD